MLAGTASSIHTYAILFFKQHPLPRFYDSASVILFTVLGIVTSGLIMSVCVITTPQYHRADDTMDSRIM